MSNPELGELGNIPEASEPVKLYIDSEAKSESAVNNVSTTINTIGYIILIVGVLAGLIIGLTLQDPNSSSDYSPDPHPLRWVYGISLIVSSAISGILLIGFGEVIKILHDIRANTKQK